MFDLPPFRSFKGLPSEFDEVSEFSEVKERARTDHQYFVREFFSHHVWGEFSEMHEYFCELESEPDRRGVQEVIAAPRGNAKTTFRVLIKAIHSIVYGYHPFIVIIGYSASEAIDKVKDIRDELLTNERLIEVYGNLLPKSAAQSDFITTNGVRVVARSRGGQVRGLKFRADRPSLIILDDIESLETVNTPEQRQKTKAWFEKDVIGSGRADGKTDFIVVGTVIHQEALLSELLQKPGWVSRKYKAIKSFATRQDLWDQWQAIYTDLDNPNAIDDAKAFYEANEPAMLEGVEILWPDGETYYKLMVEKVKHGLAYLYSEKQNEPFDPERQILNPELCKRFNVIWPQEDAWPRELKEKRVDYGFAIHCEAKYIHSSTLKIIAFHDPAMAETNKSDYGSIVVCAQDGSGYIYVLDCYLRKDPYTIQIHKAYELYKKWQFDTLYLETIGFQELLKPLYREQEERQGVKLRIVGVHQHANKVHRISTLEPYFSNGWLRLNERLDPLLLEQLRLFPTTHDDGPDALQGCVERLKRPGGYSAVIKEGNTLR